MSKYELTMSSNYVKDWDLPKAVRELYQNALDEQILDPTNKLITSYNNETLIIGNKKSVLRVDTLLLGNSTKRDDSNTVGRHGDGYKSALVVLLRNGKKVTFYNNTAGEVWTTRLKQSRKYLSQLPEITITKNETSNKGLLIVIEGITKEEYSEIQETVLQLKGTLNCYKAKNNSGRVLLDPDQKGRIYVNGLFIAVKSEFRYGYDISPKYISLDRDRRMVDTIDVALVTSGIWRYTGQEDLISKLLMENTIDVKYIQLKTDYLMPWEEKETLGIQEHSVDDTIRENLKTSFRETYGDNAIPVSTNDQLEAVLSSNKGLKPALVPQEVAEYLNKFEGFSVRDLISPKARLLEWLKPLEHKLTEEEIEDFKIILQSLN